MSVQKVMERCWYILAYIGEISHRQEGIKGIKDGFDQFLGYGPCPTCWAENPDNADLLTCRLTL